MEYPPDVMRRQVAKPGEGWLEGVVLQSDAILLSEHNASWSESFDREAIRISNALGDTALRIEHVGSTSVPGLLAKPIIDIDVWVDDSDREDAYVPALEEAGYVLVLREPWWNGHRMLVPDQSGDTPERVFLHVFPKTAPEPVRHVLFRDWLRRHDEDRDLYASVKREIASGTVDDPSRYNLAKNEVIDDIYGRIFEVPPHEHPAWESLGPA